MEKLKEIEKFCDIVKLYNYLCDKAVVNLMITNGLVCIISFALWVFICFLISNSISQAIYFVLSTIFMLVLFQVAKYSIARTYSNSILKYVSEEYQITETQVEGIIENQEYVVTVEKE